ncbi:BTAD domain-containing putative transcriptional regulator [Streptomyces mirabilis]|uniref:AfsR/SARP family transcriptional regulator n=1 Tax=Streptomyces mirabilis TaxID=68239 RepID=UPI0037122DF0
MQPEVRFSILGLMSLSRGDETVVLPSSKPTILLAAMLLRPNETVSAEYLQCVVWGDDPPTSARATLQTYVLRLRRIFASHGIVDDVIRTVPGGYQLPVTEETLDLARFRGLLRAAERSRDLEAELGLLVEALTLWQGPPLGNIRSEVLHRDEVPVLNEEWLRTTEQRFDIELELGRCRQALAELRLVARAHPGHERFWEQLIEALYRTGRQTDALAACRTVKGYLDSELGVGPGPSLQNLELAILRGAELGPAPSDSLSLQVSAAGRRNCPLPGDLSDFTGREQESAELADLLTADRQGPAIAVVTGLPGTGKTALAVHVAHLVADHFPDGRYFITMGSGGDTPSEPAAEEIAACLAATGAAERSLLVLDDVRDPEQIQRLLPSGRGSAVLITSRMSLAGLAATRGATLHQLGAWGPDQSRAMLGAMIGRPRMTAEPAEAAELAALCGHVPAALRIAAARLLLRPRQPIAAQVAWLRDDPARRLSVPGDSEMSVHRMLREFFERLDPRLAPVIESIARRPAAQISVRECAEALQLAPCDALVVLDELVAVNLLEVDAQGVHQLPDLVRSFLRSSPALSKNAA